MRSDGPGLGPLPEIRKARVGDPGGALSAYGEGVPGDVNGYLQNYADVTLNVYPAPIPREFFRSPEELRSFSLAKSFPGAAETVRGLAEKMGGLAYVTCRPGEAEFVTRRWLRLHGFPEAPVIFCWNARELPLRLQRRLAPERGPLLHQCPQHHLLLPQVRMGREFVDPVRGVKKSDTRTARRELQLPDEPAPPPKVSSVAPVEHRDLVYREFLGVLSLYPEHKEDLLRRGLDDAGIFKNGHRSIPQNP